MTSGQLLLAMLLLTVGEHGVFAGKGFFTPGPGAGNRARVMGPDVTSESIPAVLLTAGPSVCHPLTDQLLVRGSLHAVHAI